MTECHSCLFTHLFYWPHFLQWSAEGKHNYVKVGELVFIALAGRLNALQSQLERSCWSGVFWGLKSHMWGLLSYAMRLLTWYLKKLWGFFNIKHFSSGNLSSVLSILLLKHRFPNLLFTQFSNVFIRSIHVFLWMSEVLS